ncbi:MAG: hypothetical protein KF805_15570 [Phycisphaeraceae bacterium]|nr:hypothetical protein [Phycisphaeraceae bacterium]
MPPKTGLSGAVMAVGGEASRSDVGIQRQRSAAGMWSASTIIRWPSALPLNKRIQW